MKYEKALDLFERGKDMLAQYCKDYEGEISRDSDLFQTRESALSLNLYVDCYGYFVLGYYWHKGESKAIDSDLRDAESVSDFLKSCLAHGFKRIHGVRQMSLFESVRYGVYA